MGGLDGLLVWTTRLSNSIPMLSAVYSGYTSYFGTNTPFNYTDRAWIMREGRDFLWGSQNGWMHPGQLLAPENAVKAEFFRRIGKYRVAGGKFLTYGELVGFIDRPEATVQGEWPSHGAGTVTLPAVQGSIWTANDGSVGIFLVNYLAEPQAIDLDLDLTPHGLPVSIGRPLLLTSIGLEGERSDAGSVPNGILKRRESLHPWEIRLLEIGE